MTTIDEEGAHPSAAGGFAYPPELAKPDRIWLRRAAAELRVRVRRSVADVLVTGRVLAQARRRLGRGLYGAWLDAEAQVPRRSATRLVAVHRVFGSTDPATVNRFTPSALYALSQPGVPQSLREYAVEQAGGGTDVTLARVSEWIEEVRTHAPSAPVKLASKDEKVQAAVDAAEVWAPDNWRRLCRLLAPGVSLHLSAVTDAENGDPIVSAVLLGAARRTAAGVNLEAVVLELTGGGRTKVCKNRRCLRLKPLDQFSLCTSSPDGRNKYCLACERQRVSDYARRKAAEARRN